jgi:hypothetical protein
VSNPELSIIISMLQERDGDGGRPSHDTTPG